jgi:hypothetical protein
VHHAFPTTATTPAAISRLVAVGGLVLLVALALWRGADAGVIWDEEAQATYGELVLAWFRSGFGDDGALGFRNLYLYGGLFDAPAQLLTRLSPLGPYETRHVLTALLGVSGIVATWKLAALLRGPRAALLASAMLALTPLWVGHALFNPKDIPFAVFAAWGLLGVVRGTVAERPLPWRDAVLAGAGLGAALGVRPGGLFLLAAPLLAIAGRASLSAAARAPLARGELGRLLLRVAATIGIAWVIMLALWPWGQVSPLLRPFEALAESSRFTWSGPVLFEGRYLPANALPGTYLATWFLISLPELWAVAAACGLVAIAARARAARFGPTTLALALLAGAVVVPLAAAVLLRTPIYDAQRHFLFLLPPAAALGGIAIDAFLALGLPRPVRFATALLSGVLALQSAWDIVRLHPYEYVYFNRASGGLPAAAGRFETDYWGASFREGTEWVLRNIDPPTPITLGCTGLAFQAQYYVDRSPARGRFAVVDWQEPPQILLATTRVDRHRAFPGMVLHVVERDGVPLLYVIATGSAQGL